MRKIVIDEDYKIESSEELSKKVTYKILKESLKHYSQDRLEFKDDEKYKIFTVKMPDRKVNKKSKIILARFCEYELKNYTKEIVNKINTNTFLFADLSYRIDYNNLYEEACKEVRFGLDCLNDNSLAYLEIYKEKEINMLARIIVFSILTTLLRIMICTITPAVMPIYAIGYLAICCIWAKHDVEKKKMSKTTRTIVAVILAGIPFIADIYGIKLSQTLKNLIGDIKNDSFKFSSFIEKHIKEPIRKFIKKIKTPKNFKGIENELEQISKSLDNDDIGHVPIKIDEDAIIKLNTSSVIKETRKYIDQLPQKDRKMYLNKLDTLLESRKDLSIKDFNNSLFNLNNEVVYYLDLMNKNVDNELEKLGKRKSLTR